MKNGSNCFISFSSRKKFSEVSKYCFYWFISSLHVWTKSLILVYTKLDADILVGISISRSQMSISLIAQFLNLKIHSLSSDSTCRFLGVEFYLRRLKSPQINKSLSHSMTYTLTVFELLNPQLLKWLGSFAWHAPISHQSQTFRIHFSRSKWYSSPTLSLFVSVLYRL